jgi:hypothetical protein
MVRPPILKAQTKQSAHESKYKQATTLSSNGRREVRLDGTRQALRRPFVRGYFSDPDIEAAMVVDDVMSQAQQLRCDLRSACNFYVLPSPSAQAL